MQNELPPDKTKYPDMKGPSDPELRRLWKLQTHAQHYGIGPDRVREISEAADRRLRFLRIRRRVLAIAWLLTIAGILWFAYAVTTGA